jgi:hypothetical protein
LMPLTAAPLNLAHLALAAAAILARPAALMFRFFGPVVTSEGVGTSWPKMLFLLSFSLEPQAR